MTGTQEQILRDVQHVVHINGKNTAKQLIGELETNFTTMQNNIQMFSNEGVKQSANFAYWLNFLNGLICCYASSALRMNITFNST